MKPQPRSILVLLVLALLTAPACMLFTGGTAALPTATAVIATATLPPPAAPTSAAIATATPTEVIQPSPTGHPATVTAIVAPTLAATATPVATATRPPAAPVIVLPEGYEVFRHPEIADFAFPADARTWEMVKNAGYPWAFLVHKNNPSCGITAVPGRGIGTPNRVLRWQLGRLYWRVYDNGPTALVFIDQPAWLYLELHGYESAACRAAQQAVMEHVLLEDELSGKVAFALLPTATARPPLPGFTCPNTPAARLRAGDRAHIVTNDLLLRSEPIAADSTKIRIYDADSPVMIQVLDGPVCTEKYVYWKVSVGIIGEGSPEPVTGWMAEGDLNEYYLAPGH